VNVSSVLISTSRAFPMFQLGLSQVLRDPDAFCPGLQRVFGESPCNQRELPHLPGTITLDETTRGLLELQASVRCISSSFP
jgi:hypothetical protein